MTRTLTRTLRRTMAVLTALLMVCFALNLGALAAGPDFGNDIPAGAWYKAAAEGAYANGLVKGDDLGRFKGNDKLLYTELASILLNALADNPDWGDGAGSGSQGVLDAEALGLIPAGAKGSDAKATRGDLAVGIAKLLGLSGTGVAADLARFVDGAATVNPDYIAYGGELVRLNVFKGSDKNEIKFNEDLTRGEVAQVLVNSGLVKLDITADAVLSGNVAISKDAQILDGTKVAGNLVVLSSVDTLTLKDVEIGGDLILKGGASSSIHIEGDSSFGQIIIAKEDATDAIRVVIDGNVIVNKIITEGGTSDVDLEVKDTATLVKVNEDGSLTPPSIEVKTDATGDTQSVSITVGTETFALKDDGVKAANDALIEAKQAILALDEENLDLGEDENLAYDPDDDEDLDTH
ncbi:hypothetical protein FACS1894217_10000 [Clostridia bacterium]|nr:hypothetical protein FACS1894217_10000 [Clostridia bacterium]